MISVYIPPIPSVESRAVIGVPRSVEDIICSEIGILPSNGTQSRSLSFLPPPVLNRSRFMLNVPSLSIDTFSPLICRFGL